MSDPRGVLHVDVDGKTLSLHLGMTAIARLQGVHGQDVLSRLQQPDDAGDAWLPDFGIITDVIRFSLAKYHADLVSDDLIDDIFHARRDIVVVLLEAAFPPAKPGKPKPLAKRGDSI